MEQLRQSKKDSNIFSCDIIQKKIKDDNKKYENALSNLLKSEVDAIFMINKQPKEIIKNFDFLSSNIKILLSVLIPIKDDNKKNVNVSEVIDKINKKLNALLHKFKKYFFPKTQDFIEKYKG